MHGTTASPQHSRKPRRRKKSQRRRLVDALNRILEDIPEIVSAGEDRVFGALLKGISEEPPAVAACRVLLPEKIATLVLVPDRLWIKQEPMNLLNQAKSRMEELGMSCILVPQHAALRCEDEILSALKSNASRPFPQVSNIASMSSRMIDEALVYYAELTPT